MISHISAFHSRSFSTHVWVSIAFNFSVSILELCFSSQVIPGVLKNKSKSLHAYLLYRYVIIVVKICFNIFLLSVYYSNDAPLYTEMIIRLGSDIVLSIYTCFLFVIQYHVIKVDIEREDLSTITSGWYNRAYSDY